MAAALQGDAVILVRPETKPDDIHGITASVGVLTCRGGVTSHAAVVTRGMGIPCVVSCEEVRVDLEQGCLTANGRTVWAGEHISLDGETGEVYHAAYKTELPQLDEFEEGFLDRFGRNPREILRRYWQLEERGVAVHSINEDLREELMLLLRAGIAGQESRF